MGLVGSLDWDGGKIEYSRVNNAIFYFLFFLLGVNNVIG
jgi:hypothetical protein